MGDPSAPFIVLGVAMAGGDWAAARSPRRCCKARADFGPSPARPWPSPSPDAGTNTLVNLDGNFNVALGGPPVQQAQVAPAVAFLTLGLYITVFLTVPAMLTARRNVM